MGKGVFNTSDGVKVENQVGADAENIYTKAWNVKVNDAAKRVVKFTKLANASSPEAYRLHVAPDAIEISAASSERMCSFFSFIGSTSFCITPVSYHIAGGKARKSTAAAVLFRCCGALGGAPHFPIDGEGEGERETRNFTLRLTPC